jgi:hypothetical protein
MATRAETARARDQRTKHAKKRTVAKQSAAAAAVRRGKQKRNKRVKRDSAFNITETVRKTAPTQRYRKSRARGTHPRGGSH